MPSAAAQDVLQAILERRAAQKRRALGATAAPVVLPFAQRAPLKVYLNAGERDRAMGDQAPLPFSNRIAGAFEASQGMEEPSQALYAAKHQRAMDVLGNRPPEEPGFWESIASLGPRAVGGAQKMWQAAPMAAEALWNDPLGSINRAGQAGQAATDAILGGMVSPFMQFGDPNVDPVENAFDLATVVGTGGLAGAGERAGLGAGGGRLRPPVQQELPFKIKGYRGMAPETEAFRNWFKKSAVVDEVGAPLTVYRGQSAVDWNTGEPLETLQRGSEFPAFNSGEPGTRIAAFFSDDPQVANRFSGAYKAGKGSAPSTFPVHLSIQKPYVIDAKGAKAGTVQFGEEGRPFRDAIRSGKYDGVIIKNTADEGNLYIPIEPTQIKSVFNRGTYDPADPRILYSGGGKEGARVGIGLQAAKGFGEPTWKHPISANKLRRPLEEMTATYAPGSRQLPMKEFNFEDVPEGSHFVALFGDRTMGGKRLTGVNEMSFDSPVDLQAGSDFLRRQRNPEDAFWASDKGPITKLENIVRPMQETGDPVYGVTTAMASRAGDYSAQTTKTLLEMIKQQPLSGKARKAIDGAMRAPWGKKIPAYPDWPGVDKVTDEYLQGAGSARTKFAQLLDSKRIADMGGPDVGSARKAVTHPELLDAPFLGTGHRIFRLDEPVQHLTDPKVPHFDYASQIASKGGTFEGGVKPIPGVRFWVDWAKRQKPGLDEAKLGRSFMTQGVTQRHSQQWLDNLMKYTQSENGRKLGIAGAIGAGLLTSGEAMEMFGTDGFSENT